MRAIIIGLDGLEASLINPDRYPNICQAEHGRINLDGFNQIQTPQIWASFITGVMPNEHGIDGFKHNTLLSKIEKKCSGYVKKLLSFFGLGAVKWVTGIKNSLYGHYNINPYESYTKEDIRVPTLFDEIPSSHAISLPVYNEPDVYMDVRKFVARAVGDKELSHDLSEKCLDLMKDEVDEFTKYLHEDIDLVMVHLFVADVYGHLYGCNEDKILELYDIFEEFIGSVKNDALTIILSDHGTKEGLHTTYGFYSLSKPLGLDNPHITDFHDIIMEVAL